MHVLLNNNNNKTIEGYFKWVPHTYTRTRVLCTSPENDYSTTKRLKIK